MHATIRRYEGVDTTRTNEVAGKVNETLVPQLRKLPGFSGYYLVEAGNGVLDSLGLFETSQQGDESTKVVSKWITDGELQLGDSERAEDHDRQGRCAQQQRHPPRRHHVADREGASLEAQAWRGGGRRQVSASSSFRYRMIVSQYVLPGKTPSSGHVGVLCELVRPAEVVDRVRGS